MINVLADQYLYNIQSYLPESVNLQLFDPTQGLPSEVEQAHAMLIRTVIPINKQTLPNIPKDLTFIGTGSSGTDHVDSHYLANHNIHFADAAGCNARSVAEYIATVLLLWTEKRNRDLSTLSAGIIGAGHVGTEVIAILNGIGLQTVAYDPPREQRDSNFSSASLNEVLSCDVLSFHTPLDRKSEHPTYHWLDQHKLKDRTFDLIINSARGGVVDENALLNAMKKGKIRDIIIDVWEDEPEINLSTARQTFLKTPHIAGYSEQAKQNASKFIADELIDHFELESPKVKKDDAKITFDKNPDEYPTLSSLLTELHPIKRYEQQLTDILANRPQKRGELFNKLRAEFPLRQQFSQIQLRKEYFKKYPLLRTLGFSEIS
jgi:erythronate-4-phosphate dehydrogenase